MKKYVKILIVLLLVCAAAAILFFSFNYEKDGYEERSQAIIRINNLQQERAELYSQVSNLESDRDKTATGGAAVFLCFDYADSNLYEVIYPTVTYHEFRAIFTFAAGQLPDNSGVITLGQYKEILASDWEGAVKYDAAADLEAMKAGFEAMDAPFPEIMVFDKGEYSSDLVPRLQALGIKVCICDSAEDDGMMKIDSEPIMYNQSVVKVRTNRAMNDGTPLVVRTGHVKRYVSAKDHDCDLEKYEEMMRWMKIMQFQERLRLQNTYDNDSVMDMLNYSIEQAQISQSEIDRLNQRMAEIDEEIARLRHRM